MISGCRLAVLAALAAVAESFSVSPTLQHTSSRCIAPAPSMLFGFGKKEAGGASGATNARDADFARRQSKLADRQAKAASTPKGQVEVTFPQKGNKVVKAMQGDALGAVCKKAGVRVQFDCKNGRCGTCQVRINGRSAVKVCQGGKVPGGATRKIKITLDNP